MRNKGKTFYIYYLHKNRNNMIDKNRWPHALQVYCPPYFALLHPETSGPAAESAG